METSESAKCPVSWLIQSQTWEDALEECRQLVNRVPEGKTLLEYACNLGERLCEQEVRILCRFL